MKVKGLDGKEYKWYLVDHVPSLNDDRPRSSYHESAKPIIISTFPCQRVIEEIQLPGSGGLYADFFVPQAMTMIEVHGEQHYKFSKYFHGNAKGFLDSKNRDLNKEEWCSINKIKLIVLPYNEQDKWKELLNG